MTRPAVRPLVAGLAVAVSVTMLVSASVSAAASTRRPTACQILERSEIRRVVREKVLRSKQVQRTPKSASICNWELGSRGSGSLVSVWVQRGKQAREGYDVSERVFGLGSEPLPELGRLAFYSGEAGAVYVLDGSTLVYVQRLDPGGATDPMVLRDEAVELTELALERL
jgi:hypothetical protein